MKRFVLRTSMLALAAIVVRDSAGRAAGQADSVRRIPYAGYMMFGKLFEGPDRHERVGR